MAVPGLGNLTSEELSAAGAKGSARRERYSNGAIKRRAEKDVELIRERIQVGMIVSKLEQAVAGELELSSAQVQAAKVLLDKRLPTLQAVEQSQANPWDKITPEQLLEQVRALIAAHPEVMQAIQPGPRPLEAALQGHEVPPEPVQDRGTGETNAVQHGISGASGQKAAA